MTEKSTIMPAKTTGAARLKLRAPPTCNKLITYLQREGNALQQKTPTDKK